MKTKISVITMHRVLNYGSILQTVALSHFLRINGYEVEIVDYLFPNDYHKFISKKSTPNNTRESKWLLHLNGLCNRILNQSPEEKRKAFSEFLKDNLKLSRQYHTEKELIDDPPIANIYLTGSDQVWNPRYIGKDSSFFLQWVPKNIESKKVSYASSFGNLNFPEDFSDLIGPWLSMYHKITVREDNPILASLNLEYDVVLDPTFLLNSEEWKQFFNPEPIVKGKYLLCYLLGYSFDVVPYATQVMDYLHKHTGLKIVMIGGEPRNILKGYKIFNNVGPKDFLNLFYNSTMVLTTSFHGTAFAINFGKSVLTIIDGEKRGDNRQSTLISKVGCSQNIVIKKGTALSEIPILKSTVINYPYLEQRRSESKSILLRYVSSES